jgi:hypothetical protein
MFSSKGSSGGALPHSEALCVTNFMAHEQRCDEFRKAFKEEMQLYVQEGFRPNDCFPFVFQNLIEQTGIGMKERSELQRELLEWTRKTI